MKTAKVKRIPKCQLCMKSYQTLPNSNDAEDAVFDAKTKAGPWAYLCRKHFASDGIGLGMGLGQLLIKEA